MSDPVTLADLLEKHGVTITPELKADLEAWSESFTTVIAQKAAEAAALIESLSNSRDSLVNIQALAERAQRDYDAKVAEMEREHERWREEHGFNSGWFKP